MEERLELLKKLGGISSSLSPITDLHQLAEEIQHSIEEVVNVKYSAIYLFNAARTTLTLPYAKGFSEQERVEAERTAQYRHPGWVVRTRQVLNIPDLETEQVSNAPQEVKRAVRSRLLFPVISGGECVGCIELFSPEPNAFAEEHVATLTFVGNLAGIIYKNILHHQNLQKTMIATIHALSLALEKRDPYTAGHQKRVADLACAIGQLLELSENQIDGLRMAGLVHDFGKIHVPSEILSNPGQLSAAEFAIVRTHPLVGYDILKTIDFPWPVAQAVLQHHERLDGSGYPAGASGEEIITEARILAVADTLEAIASHRPYRPSLGLSKAFNELRDNSGSRYDPVVVDACLELMAEREKEFFG